MLFFQCLLLLLVCCKLPLAVSVDNNATSPYAFVSTLSSDSFLLTAKVLAYRLNTLHPSIPFIVIVTEDVSPSSVSSLTLQGVSVLQFPRIDTPYLKTHTARKYQYTKIRLWSLTSFSSLLHLDLDVLPLADLSPLFQCGAFCAAFRHSDMFNSGVFVLKPNISVYEDMMQKVELLYSYDGGDQGFLNSYFRQLKYSPMFDDEHVDNQLFNSSLMTLSSKWNYDVGMYYLNGGRKLIEPKLIHYTLGPTKPWIWWTYPLFELNSLWMKCRSEMEEAYNVKNEDIYMLLFLIPFIVALIICYKIITYMITRTYLPLSLSEKPIDSYESLTVSYGSVFASILLSYWLMPLYPHPLSAWAFFSLNLVSLSMFLSSLYASIRLHQPPSFPRILFGAFLLLSSVFLSLLILSSISSFFYRSLLCASLILFNFCFFSLTIRRLVLVSSIYCTRYQLLSKTAHA